MDLLALRTFATVARCGSITAASRELNTVQSNVTARMRQLESRLGTELFRRHSRGAALTPAGERLLGYAQKLVRLAEEAECAVRQDGLMHGRLRLGSMETTAAIRLPSLLQRFHLAHPDVALEVRTGPTAELVQRVLDYDLDCAFVAGPIEHPELNGLPAFVEELVLVRSAGPDPTIHRNPAQPLTAIVFRTGCSYRQRLETYFAQRGWMPFRRVEVGTLEGIVGFVAAGVGMTLLPLRAIEQHPRVGDLHFTRVSGTLGHAPTLLVVRAETRMCGALLALHQQLTHEP